MPFIGTTPTQGFVSSFPKQSFTPNGSTTVFTLTNPVANANDLEVFVGNVRQEPTAAYSAAGTTLTMSEAPDAGLNFYVINKSFAQVTTNPPDGSVSTAKLDTNAVTTAKIANSAITNAKIAGVATSKLSYAAGDVIQQVHTSVQDYPHPSNNGGHIASDGNGAITETTAWDSASLTPLLSLAITKKITASKLVVNLTGRFDVTQHRSQIVLYDSYTPGASRSTNNSIGYHHYGLYNSTGGHFYCPGSFEYAITGVSAGTSKTYHWFGGSIGGTQKYWGLTMTITEIAT